MLELHNTVMVLVDLQDKLLPAMHNTEALLDSTDRLVRGMLLLEAAILWAEQNPAGLGATSQKIAKHLPGEAISKMSFGCCGEKKFISSLESLNRKQVVLAGIETHVCVYQTAIELIRRGYQVHVVSDAVSSRTPENKAIGLQLMKAAGASITSMETVLFELMKAADGEKFKELLKIVK